MKNGNKRIEPEPERMQPWTHEGAVDSASSRTMPRTAPTANGLSGPRSDECLWDIAAVSVFLGVPVATIYQWRVKGEGPPATRMGKHLRYEPALVRAWVSEHRESA